MKWFYVPLEEKASGQQVFLVIDRRVKRSGGVVLLAAAHDFLQAYLSLSLSGRGDC